MWYDDAIFGNITGKMSQEYKLLEDQALVADEAMVVQEVQYKGTRKYRIAGIVASLLAVLVLVSVLIVIATTRQGRRPTPVVLISLDGFRAEYLERGITPNLQSLIDRGTHAPYTVPEFPSKTFPNHWSIVTGLYPASHGIVDNEFYDAQLGETFAYWNGTQSTDAKWFQGEPIWNTLQHHGLKSYVCFWPGSEAPVQGMRPDIALPYEKSKDMNTSERADQVLDWVHERFNGHGPDLIAMYLSTVDSNGHKYGPDSKEVEDAIRDVDQNGIGRLIQGLGSDIDHVNIIIVSDHGMTSLSNTSIQYLEDVQVAGTPVLDLINVYGFSPVLQIAPKNSSQSVDILQALNGLVDKYQTFNQSTMPLDYFYRGNQRISPLVAVAKQPWSLLIKKNDTLPIKGSHGYDPSNRDMHSIFIGAGPQFQKTVLPQEQGMRNLEVYRVMCSLLGVEPASNNGSISMDLILN